MKLNNDEEDTEFECKTSLMKNYGLTGRFKPSDKKHPYCPGVRRTCCSVPDIQDSMNMWINEDREFVEMYYMTYLRSIEYLLGWNTEIKSLAEEFKPSGSITNIHSKKYLNMIRNKNKDVKLRLLEEIIQGQMQKQQDPKNIKNIPIETSDVKQQDSAVPDKDRKRPNKVNKKKPATANDISRISDIFDYKSMNRVEFEDGLSDVQKCNVAASVIIEQKTNISMIKADFRSIKSYIMKLLEVRKGFYCTICDADTQENLSKAWNKYKENDHEDQTQIFFGSGFCTEFSNIAIPFFKFVLEILKPYLDSAATLMTCKKNHMIEIKAQAELNKQNKKLTFENRPEYKIEQEEAKLYLNCSLLKNNKSIFSCKEFCEIFDLTSPNSLVDGDLVQTKIFVIYFKRNKNLFNNSENNVLIPNQEETESTLLSDWNSVFMKNVFFTSTDNFGMLDQHNTVVLLGEGTNPFHTTEDNGYALAVVDIFVNIFVKMFLVVGALLI